MSDVSEDKKRCVLCGVEREGPMYGNQKDHLRMVFVSGRNPPELDAGYYRPKLGEDELRLLGRGEQFVCSSRRGCSRRRAGAAKRG